MVIDLQTLYPNPAVEVVNLEFNTDTEGAMSIQIFNVAGQLQLDIPVNTNKGENRFSLDISTIASGTYYVKMVGSTVNEQPLQFVKVK